MRKTVKAWAYKEGKMWVALGDKKEAVMCSCDWETELHPCTITIDVKEKKRGKRKSDRE